MLCFEFMNKNDKLYKILITGKKKIPKKKLSVNSSFIFFIKTHFKHFTFAYAFSKYPQMEIIGLW